MTITERGVDDALAFLPAVGLALFAGFETGRIS